MSGMPTVTAWEQERDLVDESTFTPDAPEGWLSWNGQSPELSVCAFVHSLVTMMRPRLVIETGVGQGYMTRTIVPLLDDGQQLIAFESDGAWREALWTLPFWTEHRFTVQLSGLSSPERIDISVADLCVFDSDFEHRFSEIRQWHTWAKPGAVALIHDTAEREGTIHQSVRDLIGDLGMTGVFLNNPRGCFMAVQPKEK